jgi:hypothetical protein
MDNLKARCKLLDDRLKARGVVDVKFAYGYPRSTGKTTIEQVEAIINAVLDGKFKPAAPLGDSQRTVPKMLNPMAQGHGEHQGESHETNKTSGTQASP